MNTVIVENCKTLFIGRRGENEVTEVVFDFSEWQSEFGNGVIDLFVKRNGDSAAYPVVLSVDGTVATWLVTATDTNVADYGKAEYVYTVNGKIAKSAVFTFYVAEDIGQASGEAPDPYEDWIETLTGLGTETQLNAQAAEQSANDAAESAASAATSADQSEDSAEDAEAWAVGERNGEPVTEGDPTYNNNAKFWAGKAMTDAPVTSVNGKAGDIVLDLDDIPNGEQYARTTPAQVQQIGTNAADIADIEELIPTEASANNKLVDKNYVDSGDQTNTDAIAAINAKIPPQASASNQLADKILVNTKLMAYRKATDQDAIDSAQDGKINALTNLLNKKQSKITANGILKGDGNGGISAAVAGMDYLPTSALYAYRSANAQDAIDNAQNENINKNTAALTTMQPAATAADIGKALIVKTVADGKPTSYEYGEAGGGGSALTAGDGIDISNDVISNTQGIEYIVGTQTAATSKWTGVSTDETLKVGKIIAYYLPYAGTSTAVTLALTMADGTTTREISLQLKPNATVTTQFPAGSIIILVYDGTYWRVNASYDTDTNTNPTGYCLTNGSVAAKAATCSFGYRGDANYFPCLFRFANTATDATLAITTYAPEAAPIYVNGQRTSATNTFSAGVILFLYYNGAYYCYNDGRFPILVDGTVTSVQEYVGDLKSAIDTNQDDIQRLDKSWQSDKNFYGLFAQYPMPSVRFASLGVNVFSDGKRFFTDYNPAEHKVSGGLVFYYSPDGNNSNDGSREHPKKTITRPYNNLATYIFMDGVYDRTAIPEINKNVNIIAENPGKVLINHADFYEYTLSDGVYSTARNNISGVTIKIGEYFRPLTPVYNLANCKSTPFSFFSDTTVVYINVAGAVVPNNSNTFLNLSDGSPLVSVVSDVDNINVYFEGITFIGGYAGGVVVQNTASYKPTVHFNRCKFIGAYTLTNVAKDALSVLGGNAYLYKCEAAFARKDGFNYHSLNNVAPKAIEIDCIAHDNGFGWNDNTCNGSTAHDGACVIRINGVYYNNKGANVADVMEDTVSLNLACLAFNSKSGDTGNSSDYAAQQAGTEMWLDGCKGYGSDWTIYALTGTTVHLHSVEKETTQGGGTIDDAWNPYT